ncbi:protein ITPRID1 isoform X2 [Myxocyprinus asiaticus]|uniref:protein ITPRID1 isoform X2 n=1 Tax=Myxocyprinus asiaticus TaxID=70543 RepID=UPI00222368F9|nr:protein ITPRID1 isoform X2 [Myxocyprinus asiaticus]
MSTVMATDLLADRRAILRASWNRWSRTNNSEIDKIINTNTRNCDEDIVQCWLTSVPKDDAKPDVAMEMAMKPIRRNRSAEDDLALGVEASLYSKLSLGTVWSFRRSSVDPPSLSRLNSFASGVSIQSGVSVMDVLTMLKDDPEELLLDLGFGIDEPDITGRIPARFLNYQSSAHGISFQLFLEAQQSRMDIENPDVRNRFRQLEVLQQVTTTFSSLVGPISPGADASLASRMSVEARERRKRMAMILRRASKKSLSHAQMSQNQQTLSPTNLAQSGVESSGASPADKIIPLKRSRQSFSDNSGLPTLQEEQSSNFESAEPILISHPTRGTTDPLKLVSDPMPTEGILHQPVESFELEEIQSFDEGSVSGHCSGPVDPGGERLGSNVIRTNSCQSDSSGFLEEPFVPALSQQNSPGSELMKMLNGISQDSTESQQKSTEQQNTEGPSADKQNSGTQFGHITHSRNTVLRTADSGTINNTVDSYTVLGKMESRTHSTQKSTIWTEKANSNSLSPDISKIKGNGVCALVYSVQMDPVCYPPEIRDKLQSLDQRVGKQRMSLFDELKSAETNSTTCPTDLGTGVEMEVATCADPYELGVKDQISRHSNQMCDSLTSYRDKNVTSDTAFGHDSPAALKRRRESFSKRSRSDVATDNDSGTAQTPTTNTPFTSVETCPAGMWKSMECSRGLGHFRTRSMSLDTGLSYEEEDHRWEGMFCAGTQRCSHCGSQISSDNGWEKPQPEQSSNLPYSLDELEEMMKCMRKFQSVLTEIEVRLEEQLASVHCSLTDSHREEVKDILRIREAVKQEAGMLEQQLSDLVHHYGDSIKMKLNRLLDEQSQLCSQLRITPSERPRLGLPSTRSVGTQCCLLPVTSNPLRCVHHHCTCQRAACHDPHKYQTQWGPNCKPDRLDFVAFIKSLKNSLQHSTNNNSLE